MTKRVACQVLDSVCASSKPVLDICYLGTFRFIAISSIDWFECRTQAPDRINKKNTLKNWCHLQVNFEGNWKIKSSFPMMFLYWILIPVVHIIYCTLYSQVKKYSTVQMICSTIILFEKLLLRIFLFQLLFFYPIAESDFYKESFVEPLSYFDPIYDWMTFL